MPFTQCRIILLKLPLESCSPGREGQVFRRIRPQNRIDPPDEPGPFRFFGGPGSAGEERRAVDDPGAGAGGAGDVFVMGGAALLAGLRDHAPTLPGFTGNRRGAVDRH